IETLFEVGSDGFRENQGLADYVLKKKRELTDKPKGLSEFQEKTFLKGYRNVCDAKDPINTLKDLSLIKGFGKWMLKHMKGYFDTEAASSEQEDLPEIRPGNGAKGRKHYIPQRNSVAYALLITLHRGTPNEKDFMLKQQLIDAADASGLSHAPVAPEKGKGKAGLGQSKRECYSGWSCMTTLIQKGLVVKSSNPAKYMLTIEGREVAKECIMRSGLSNSHNNLSDDERDHTQPYANPKSTPDSAGLSRAQTCQIDLSDDEMDLAQPHADPKSQADLEGFYAKNFWPSNDGYNLNPCSTSLRNFPRLPPLVFGEFATKGNKVDNIRSEFKIKIEVRRLPVGDCIWIAQHKYNGTEYVLDFIVERKNVDDMRASFIDNRYRDQKLRLQRSGLKKLIYILEGDPNQCDASESIKTACFTTEIREGFDVLRTQGLGETLRKYCYLTKSIYQYYKSRVNDDQTIAAALCPSFDEFVKRCQDLDKVTTSDVFAIQLMQVPQVTEEIAIAVLDMHPTLLSLASAYSHLEGNVSAQEEMLRKRSNNLGHVSGVDYNPETAASVEFVRVKIDWNVANPLRFQKMFQFSPGVNTLLKFRYERLRGFCEVCGLMTHDSGECIPTHENLEQNFEDEDNSDGHVPEDVPMDHAEEHGHMVQPNAEANMDDEEEEPFEDEDDGDQQEPEAAEGNGIGLSPQEIQEMELILNPMKEMEERQQLFLQSKRQSESYVGSRVVSPSATFNLRMDGDSVISNSVGDVKMEGTMLQYGSFLMEESDQSSGSKSRKRNASTIQSGMLSFFRELYADTQEIQNVEPVTKRSRLNVSPIRMPLAALPNGDINALQQLQSVYKDDDEEGSQIPTLTRGAVGPKPPESP
ncbi:hypothetical protein AALP_AA7G152000, partial [Arabis alpina]